MTTTQPIRVLAAEGSYVSRVARRGSVIDPEIVDQLIEALAGQLARRSLT